LRKTKIVCTIGPASGNSGVVRRLLSYVDVFRINFSHGDAASHLNEIRTIRAESERSGKRVAILQDLPGPKIRVGRMKDGAADLSKGSLFMLMSREVLGDPRRASVNHPDLLDSVDRGDLLYLADGLIKLRVEQKTEDGVECFVLAGGVLSSGKGVNAPGVKMRVNYPTPQDVEHLRFGLSHAVDFVAASFVRAPEDVRAIRRLLKSGPQFLIAKIEKREAVENFDAILDEADGVMVARGDLGIETPIQRVPLIQKEIVRKCNAAGKPVIVATQMLISMVNSPVPSRAEVTDVSTAILDGTDAVMLSDETAVGKYPVESAKMLDSIARSTERILRPRPATGHEVGAVVSEEAIGRAACNLADLVGAKAIVAPTQTGLTAKRVAMCRPRQPIVALCTEPRVARMLKLYNGVIPVVSRPARTVDWLFKRADLAAAELGLARKGERIVVTCGTPGIKGTTNLIRLSVVGSPA
jgi:pyruvate kinase